MVERNQNIDEVRAAIRSGALTGPTAGFALGYLQTNLVILPQAYALDFARFCVRNPKACPLVDVSDRGSPLFPNLGQEIDYRYDASGYNLYRDGEMVESATNVEAFWHEDLVGFALGCSFSFEAALLDAGIAIAHISEGRNVPMYETNVANRRAGPFGGNLVVSMRPLWPDQLDKVNRICALYPSAHGQPLSQSASELGIETLDSPKWGEAVIVEPGQVPAFWACGVTPQLAAAQAKLPFFISHKPGHMLLTEIRSDQVSVP